MASKLEKEKYLKAKATADRFDTAHSALNIITGILGCAWAVGMSAAIMWQTFTWLLNYFNTHGMHMAGTIGICAAITAVCITAVVFGIFTAIHAYWTIDQKSNIGFGVCDIIFGLGLPGILYIVTMILDKHSVCKVADPEVVEEAERMERKRQQEEAIRREKERKRKEQNARDPRRKFTIDDDDVGVVPDVNRIDFDEYDEVFEEEGKEESLD